MIKNQIEAIQVIGQLFKDCTGTDLISSGTNHGSFHARNGIWIISIIESPTLAVEISYQRSLWFEAPGWCIHTDPVKEPIYKLLAIDLYDTRSIDDLSAVIFKIIGTGYKFPVTPSVRGWLLLMKLDRILAQVDKIPSVHLGSIGLAYQTT